ncbi:MAG: S8 family serine peptidase, partial [Betaproteobacteria bacterium]|nr:S8 family serine peptidase [Betaproteobacteria bacterium]
MKIHAASKWPLTMLNATVAHAQGYTGKGVTVGIIDTGVDVVHWELASKIVNPTSAGDERLAAGKKSQNSHGTSVAGIIVASSLAPPASLSKRIRNRDVVGIAPDARLYVITIRLGTANPDRAYSPVRISSLRSNDDFYANRFGSLSEHVSIINNSFGYTGLISESIYTSSALNGALANTVMTIAQDAVNDSDKVLYVWAAGNNHGRKVVTGTVTSSLDASSPGVLAGLPYRAPRLKKNTVVVVALRPNRNGQGQISSYSNRCGVAADFCIAAPGGGRSTSERIGVVLAIRDRDGKLQRGYGVSAGTSIAAPYVSGALAILMEAFPSLGATEVLARLLATADKSGIYATATIYGQGLVDLEAAVKQVGDTSLLTSANLQGMRWPVDDSSLEAAAAFGDALIESLRGVSVAAYDDLDAPFAVALDRLLVEDGGSARPVAIDALNAPALPMWGERTHAVGPASDGWFGLAAGGLLPGSLPRAAFAQPYLDLLPERAVGAGVQMNQDRRRLRAATFLAPGEDSGEPAAAAVAFEYAPTRTRLGGYESGSGWLLHAGALAETARFLGGSSKGAFGSLRATSLFAGLAGSAVLAGSWSVHGRADAGVSRPKAGGGIVRRIGPAVTSSWALGISGSDI